MTQGSKKKQYEPVTRTGQNYENHYIAMYFTKKNNSKKKQSLKGVPRKQLILKLLKRQITCNLKTLEKYQ